MRRRIFGSMYLLVLITVLLSSLLISGLMYHKFFNLMKQEIKNEAGYIGVATEMEGIGYLTAVKNTVNFNRITLIASNGTVLFDNTAPAENLDNHGDRPEVKAALEQGFGEATRLSDTLGSQTFYYALRLTDGTVLRIANTMDSIYKTAFNGLSYMVLIILVTLIVAMLLANWQTQKIVEPINNLDLGDPMSNQVYDELAPLLTRIAKQNQELEKKMGQLRLRQEEFMAITGNMREGLIVLNVKGAVLSINQSAMRIFGVKHDAWLHKHILTLNRSMPVQIAVEKGLSGISWEEMLEFGGRQYQLMANPVGANGIVGGAVLLILDVTEKQAAEQMRREFSANVSHELRTPLTSISGYAEIMKNGLVKQEDLPRFSERIYIEANRLITLIEDIMQLSRLDENKQELPWEEVDLLALAQEVSDRLTPQAQSKGVEFTVLGERTIMYGARQILEEIVYNLCDNAIKYNREKGQVTVNLGRLAKEVVLTVTDTGIGIPREHHARVFERFYRVDKSHSKNTGGTGLGLSIVKHGVLYHKGKIQLESEVGKGTRVTVRFPAL